MNTAPSYQGQTKIAYCKRCRGRTSQVGRPYPEKGYWWWCQGKKVDNTRTGKPNKGK